MKFYEIVSKYKMNLFINKFKKGIINFHQNGCEKCEKQYQNLVKIKNKYKKKIEIGLIDVSEHWRIGQEYRILQVPTIFLYANHRLKMIKMSGELDNRIVGLIPYETLEKIVNWLVSL